MDIEEAADEAAEDAVDEGPETPDDEDKNATLVSVAAEPPVLDLNLGSPRSLSFSVAS